MKEEQLIANINNNNNAKGHRKRRKRVRPPGNEKTGCVEHVPDDGDSGGVSERLDAVNSAKDCHVESVASAQDEATRAGGVADWDGKSLALLCASLAFQKEMRRQIWEKRAKIGATPENKGLPDGWRTANGMFVGAREAETVKMETGGEEVKEDKDNARIKSEEAATTTTNNNNNNNNSKNVLPPDGGIGAKSERPGREGFLFAADGHGYGWKRREQRNSDPRGWITTKNNR